jgi:hypothetical protein
MEGFIRRFNFDNSLQAIVPFFVLSLPNRDKIRIILSLILCELEPFDQLYVSKIKKPLDWIALIFILILCTCVWTTGCRPDRD